MKKLVCVMMVIAIVAAAQATIIPGDWTVQDVVLSGSRDFTNAYGVWPTAATDYYQDAAYDWNPTNPGAFGMSFNIAVESQPEAGQDQEAGIVHFGAGSWPSLALEIHEGYYTLHIPGSSFDHAGAITGGTDHIELTYVDGLWTMELNGAVELTKDWGSGYEYDPQAGLVIGAMNGATWGQGVVRGIDATISDVTLYGIPEPATMALLGLGALVLRRKK